MKFSCYSGESTRGATSTDSGCHWTGVFEMNSMLRWNNVSDERVPGEWSLDIVEIPEKGVYIVTVVVVAAVVVAAVGVVAGVVKSRLIAVVVVVRDALISMLPVSSAAMMLMDVNGRSVVSYG
jgi:hypothetical protein